MESQNTNVLGGEIAGKGRRFGTFLVDYLLFYVLCGILGTVIRQTFGAQAVEGGTGLLIVIAAYLAYYAGFEGTIGRTPGKLVFGTRVVTNTGSAPSFGQAIGRTLSRVIPFEPLSVLFAPDDEAIGWHDSIAGTKVIKIGS